MYVYVALVFLVILLDTDLPGFAIWKRSQEFFFSFSLSIVLRKQSRLKNQVEHKESLDKQKRAGKALSVSSTPWLVVPRSV